MSKNPRIILHPGLPKCATSTIQRLFVVDDYRLGSDLGVKVIGGGFRSENGYPEVSKLMYSPQKFIDEVDLSTFDGGYYFYSNEALLGSKAALEAIERKFSIATTIFTVRFPPLQGLSQFNYSGWLTSTFDEFIKGKFTSPLSALDRFKPHLEKFSQASERVLVCPIERLKKPLLERFVGTCFGFTPSSIAEEPFSKPFTANKSIGVAFAQALAVELRRSGMKAEAQDRNRFVKLAQSYCLPSELSRLRPPEITMKWSQETGQSAKVFPEPLKGYEHGKAPELYRSV